MVDLPAASDGAGDGLWIADVSANQVDLVEREVLDRNAREVQHADGVTPAEQRGDQVCSDEPRASSYQDRAAFVTTCDLVV